MAEGDVHNNYEYAYLSLARYYYAARYGTPMEQMRHLTSALGEDAVWPNQSSFLPNDIARSVRRVLFQLNVQNQYLQEALRVWQLMEARGDSEGLALFRAAYEQLMAFKGNDDPYSVDAQLDELGSWYIELFKNSFYLDGLSGSVAELKLRCQRDYVFFAFESDIQYDISGGSGECSLEVIGEPGTTFTLVQQ